MSGPLTHDLAAAESTLALQAQAKAEGLTVGRFIGAQARKAVEANKGREAQSLPARTWAAMPLRTRTVLAMLGALSSNNPDKTARQQWDTIPEGDRMSMAAIARDLGKSLRDAACLF